LLDTGCLLSPPAPIAVANGGGENFQRWTFAPANFYFPRNLLRLMAQFTKLEAGATAWAFFCNKAALGRRS